MLNIKIDPLQKPMTSANLSIKQKIGMNKELNLIDIRLYITIRGTKLALTVGLPQKPNTVLGNM